MPRLHLSWEHSLLYDGTGRVWPLTAEQMAVLTGAAHLVVAEVLADGDLLILDTGMANLEAFPDGHFGPYVLAGDGRLQDVNYHYRHSHGVDVPAYPDRPAGGSAELDQPSTRGGGHSDPRRRR